MIRLLVVSLKLSLQLARWSCMLSPQPVKVATCTSTVCNIKSDRVFKKLIIFWANVIPWSWLFLGNPIFFLVFSSLLFHIDDWCGMFSFDSWEAWVWRERMGLSTVACICTILNMIDMMFVYDVISCLHNALFSCFRLRSSKLFPSLLDPRSGTT